jgi:small-conductance mechanosensitive channel
MRFKPRKHRLSRKLLIVLTASAVCLTGGLVWGQEAAGGLDRDAILGHLNAVISWYRDATSKVQSTGLPSEAIYQDNAQVLAAQAVRLAFQSARAEASLIDASAKAANKSNNTSPTQKQAGPTSNANPNANSSVNQPSAQPSQRQNLEQTRARVSAQIDDAQQKLEAANKSLASAAGAKRRGLLAERDRLTGLITLNKALLDAIEKMSSFVEGSSEAGEGLEGSIHQLARSVPEVLNTNDEKKAQLKSVTAQQQQPPPGNSSGLIGQSLTLFGQVRSIHEIDQIVTETEHLRDTVERLRKPMRDEVVATIQGGRELADQSQAAPPDQTQSIAQEFQSLTARFKQLSSATLPLSQELLVIAQTRANFLEWRKAIVEELKYTLRALAIRVIGIALALAVIFVLSEVWRRLTFRYVHDPRRRRQFLVMRRFVMGFLAGVVLIMGFVSEFSSLATFAGFVTAGIAVGLQAVLLSIAAYFFVVGRYGIRVNDRISVAGVTGDVIDIGLVRLYLIELAGTGIDLYPTGRIVMFSNSVLFQAGTPLFKQIPGTEYAWHEMVASLVPGSNYKLVQEKFLTAVNFVYEKYRAAMERQLGSIESRLEVQLKAPVPEAKLQFADTGLEFVVRYPVDIRRASEIDDQVTRAVLNLLDKDSDLKASVSGTPRIRAAIKG